MTKELEQAEKEIVQHREEIVDKLVKFSITDMLLFWGQQKDLIEVQQKIWAPILEWAKNEFNTKFVITHGIDVSEENQEAGYRMRFFLENLSNKELAAFYKAALNMRSTILAAALVKGYLSAEQVYEAAFVEEIWQAQNWGVEEDAQNKRMSLKKELIEIEDFLKK